jgi:hypothetical protein
MPARPRRTTRLTTAVWRRRQRLPRQAGETKRSRGTTTRLAGIRAHAEISASTRQVAEASLAFVGPGARSHGGSAGSAVSDLRRPARPSLDSANARRASGRLLRYGIVARTPSAQNHGNAKGDAKKARSHVPTSQTDGWWPRTNSMPDYGPDPVTSSTDVTRSTMIPRQHEFRERQGLPRGRVFGKETPEIRAHVHPAKGRQRAGRRPSPPDCLPCLRNPQPRAGLPGCSPSISPVRCRGGHRCCSRLPKSQ